MAESETHNEGFIHHGDLNAGRDIIQTIVGGDQYDIKFYAFASLAENGKIDWAQYRTKLEVKALEPYKFLSYYDTTDADLFFGREAISQELVGKIANHKLVLINGKSGSGKTSLINAGIIPLLVARGYFTMVFRDYGYPTETIKKGLASLKDSNINLSDSHTLLDCLRVTIEQTQRPVAIFLDQFERFFLNLPTDRRRQFARELKDCLNDGNLNARDMNVVISLREDFFGKLGEFWQDIPEFNTESYQHYLEPLNKVEATEAIKNPLAKIQHCKLGYDRDFLANCLVPSLWQRNESESNQQIEPVHLQIVCNRLFEEVRDRDRDRLEAGEVVLIDRKIYDNLGGVEGILQGYVEAILNRHYSREQQDEVKSVLKQLVTSQGTREFKSVAQIAETIGLKKERVAELIQQLDGSRLIETIPAAIDGDRKYSITHEYLAEKINQWYTLTELDVKRARELYERCLLNWKLNRRNVLSHSQLKYLRKYKTTLLKWKPEGKQLFKQSESGYRKSNLYVTVVAVTLVLVTIAALIGQRNSAIGQVRNARENAEKLFDRGNKQLEALTQALKAGKILETHPLLRLVKPDPSLQTQVRVTLRRVVYKTQERNRLNHKNEVISAEFIPNSNFILTASGNTAQIWNHQGELESELEGHEGWIYSAQFSVDRTIIVTASQDPAARIWNRQGQLIETLEHGESVRSAQLCPINNTIVTASLDGTARVWSSEGKLLLTLEHPRGVNNAKFSPNCKLIVTASEDGIARVWNIKGNKNLKSEDSTPLYSEGFIKSAQFSPDGNTILTLLRYEGAEVYNLQGKRLAELKGHQGNIYSANFSPSGNFIVTTAEDKTAKVWRTQGSYLETELKGHQDRVWDAQFSDDDRFIVTASRDETARVWNMNGKELAKLGHQDGVKRASFSADGKTIITASEDRTARIWNVPRTELLIRHPNASWVNSAKVSPDGNFIVTTGNSAIVSNRQGQTSVDLEHESTVNSAEFNRTGNLIVTASSDKTVRVWNLDGTELKQFEVDINLASNSVHIAQFSPDGETIVTASADRIVRIWNLQKSEDQNPILLTGHDDWIYSVQFNPLDGKTIVTASADKTARIWNLQGEELKKLEGHNGWIYSAQFSPDGKTIVTASADKTVRIWNLQGEELKKFELEGALSVVRSAEFSPDGNFLLTTSEDDIARIWDIQGNDKNPVELPGNWSMDVESIMVKKADFSPDGNFIVTAAETNARIWNLKGELLDELQGHTDGLTSVQFSPDGHSIVTTSIDGTARLWEFPPLSELMTKACARSGDYLKHLKNSDRTLCDDVPIAGEN